MRELIASGDVIAGRFRVERVLGRGGMGVVVAATHIALDRRYAIKLLASGGTDQQRAMERFLREARAASALNSEHVCRVFDFGSLDDGTPFMVMEYLEGNDFATVLSQRGPMPLTEVARHILQACEALAEAHSNGIIHRDLKPANLFLARKKDGSHTVKVLDFGIAKLLSQSGALPVTSTLLGSPLYMSPEQLRARRELDARTDIWSLGVTIYQLLTGSCPFNRDNIVDLIADIVGSTPSAPSRVAPDLPSAIDAVILRCLEKDAAARYQDIATLARALLPFAAADAALLVDRIACMPSRSREASNNPIVAAETPYVGSSSITHGATDECSEELVQATKTLESATTSPATEPIFAALDAPVPPSSIELSFFEGVWRAWLIGTVYYARITHNELRIVYRYGRDALPDATAECYDCRLVGNTLFARFRWFRSSDMHGYIYLRYESKNRLVGGWRYHYELGPDDVHNLPALDNEPFIWIREDSPAALPDWVERYFDGQEIA